MQATPKPPLDSADVRRRLVDTLRRDLIGPCPDPVDADLARERLRELPSRWYLTGYLVPADEAPLANEEDDEDTLRDQAQETSPEDEEVNNSPLTGGGEDEGAGDGAATRRRPRQTTVGLSVLVPDGTETLEALVEWGDYRAEPPIAEALVDPDGTSTDDERSAADAAQWIRVPREVRVSLDIARAREAGSKGIEIPVPESAAPQRRGGGLVLHVVARPTERRLPEQAPEPVLSVTVMLVNKRPAAARRYADVSYAFQVRLTLRAESGFRATSDITGYGSDDADLRLHDLHYRNVESYGWGRNTSVAWSADEDGTVRSVRTEPLPEAEVEKVDQNKALEELGFPLSMDALADLCETEAIADALAPLPDAYADFITSERGKLGAFDPLPKRREVAETLVKAQERARERITDGIALLGRDAVARLAFRAMNEAVSSALKKRLKIDDPKWRPFQLAFILLNLEGLTNRNHGDRDVVDLLFFPTGGGKTEAYLGLSAYTIAHRRLTKGGYLGAGVTVIMRYTLRLLTLDQLSRAAGVVCALELMRRDPRWQGERDEKLLGEWPIEIGLWIGTAGSPNWLGGKGNTGEDMAVTRVRAHLKDAKKHSAPAPLRECPWCRTRIERDGFDMWPNFQSPSRMTVRCANVDCEFSGDLPLPILAVDEEIYNRLPAFLIATVDKFAQLPWRGAVGSFFGHVDRVVPDHAFYGADRPGEGHPFADGECLPPPDLVIQDELHLISGPLGTVAGLYEAAIDALSTRTVNGREVRPKIVASTATVRRADSQITALFDRSGTTIFPPPGIDRENSWFAITRPAHEVEPRLYVGLAALGNGPRVVFLKALITLMAAAQAEQEAASVTGGKSPADPYLTAVCYFNALRELGGARRIVEDEVRAKLGSYGTSRRRVDPHDQPFRDRLIGEPVELTSRVSTDDVAVYKDRLDTPVGGDGFADVALATNMISVGLDITRLGLMLVQGQPKSAAEYIQATSRVGRDEKRPGLVLAILNLHKPRDRAHYESFGTFHGQFYRAVEATSVTPWSTRAQDRALAAAVVAMVRHNDERFTRDEAALDVQREDKFGEHVSAIILDRACRVLKDPRKQNDLRNNIETLLRHWHDLATERADSSGTFYFGEKAKGENALLHRPLDPDLDQIDQRLALFTTAWSMRDVEPAVALRVCNPRGQPLK